jgi:hypothetical protein
LTTQREGKINSKTVANRDYFLRMLEDYKNAYEDRIQILTNQNITDKNNVFDCCCVLSYLAGENIGRK